MLVLYRHQLAANTVEVVSQVLLANLASPQLGTPLSSALALSRTAAVVRKRGSVVALGSVADPANGIRSARVTMPSTTVASDLILAVFAPQSARVGPTFRIGVINETY